MKYFLHQLLGLSSGEHQNNHDSQDKAKIIKSPQHNASNRNILFLRFTNIKANLVPETIFDMFLLSLTRIDAN